MDDCVNSLEGAFEETIQDKGIPGQFPQTEMRTKSTIYLVQHI